MLVKRYIALSHTCCKTEGGLEISVHFVLIRRPNEPDFSTKFMISKVYLVL